MRNFRREKIVTARGTLRLIFAQPLDFAWNNQIFVAAESDAMLCRKALGAFCDKINMRTVAKNLACCANRIPKPFDATNPSPAKRSAIHDERVELHLAIAIQKAASASVESLVVLHHNHGFFDRIESRAAAFEGSPSGVNGIAHAVKMRIDHVIGNSPGAAVYDQDRVGWQIQTPQEIPAFSLASVIA